VNADDPLACMQAIELAYSYQQRFSKDVLIDLVGYRRYGHNEMDEPRTTQPLLYQEIDEHPRISSILKNQLKNSNIITTKEVNKPKKKSFQNLRASYDGMKEADDPEIEIGPLPKAFTKIIPWYNTCITEERLDEINKDLLRLPQDFHPNQKLMRILNRNQHIVRQKGNIDWALAEAFSYASILQEGIPIRLTGQDSERGTFAHRHYV